MPKVWLKNSIASQFFQSSNVRTENTDIRRGSLYNFGLNREKQHGDVDGGRVVGLALKFKKWGTTEFTIITCRHLYKVSLLFYFSTVYMKEYLS